MSYSIAQSFDEWAEFDELWSSLQNYGDEDFYRTAIEKYGRPALELGVGYGRMACRTHPEWGVDLSPESLERCRKRVNPSVQLLTADIGDYSLPDPVPFSYAPLNTFNHVLDSQARVQAFRNIRRNTVKGGRLLFDSHVMTERQRRERHLRVFNPVWTESHAFYYAEKIIDFERWIFEVTGSIEYVSSGVVERKVHYRGPRRAYIPPHQFAIELGRAGWYVEGAWGDFEGTLLNEASMRQVWLAVNP
ncbi:class I SAM-dependent methyltransferase [Streptomyces sp. NPDC007983]|uniref:class I SAM-dependent methyltransferase n=1 Tax=Streptomyces sp. NPDC007983 TaxID=3364800 RepID=UPI0036E91D0F